RAVRDWQDKKVEVDFALIGNKAVSFFRRVGGKVLGTATHLGDKPRLDQLLPVEKVKPEGLLQYWDYLYEPGSVEVVDTVMQRYVESQVYRAVIENAACEQSARMVAMKSASDNAGKIIGKLQLSYNKARQASITKELSEIVGGAAAV